ncbi:glucosyl transferase [Streptococcus salivarius]|uniref:glucosyl transferase n=1 Tax=Streptococcus salivarius TaxID=1304 RepID=UPI00397D4EA6
MKVHSNFTGQKSTKRLIAFSCATALASFAFIARPAFAEEAKADNTSNLDATTATTTNVETTADLVETKVVEAPATTEKAASTESTTNVSEQATTSAASSETASETASITASESQSPAESATGQTREAVTTDQAANEAASANETSNSETNVTGGQYYRDEYGYWHYKDASGKNLTGPQTIDGVKVYFNPGGVQVKGGFGWDGHYYDKDSGALVTNKFVEEYGRTYYVDENGNKAIGSKEINGAWNYFDKHGELITNNFAPDGRYYDKYGKQVDFGRNRYFELNGEWYYAGNDGAILKGPQTIDGVKVYFHQNGMQAKGYFVKDEEDNKSRYYDKDSGALVKNQYFNHNGKWYYADAEGNILKGSQTIDGVHVYFDSYGVQAKDTVLDGYYYDKDSGARKELPRDQFIKIGDDLYYLSSNGRTGEINIDGKDYYIAQYGRVLRGSFNVYQQPPYYDDETGEAVKKTGFVKSYGRWYYLEENGKKAKGFKEIDGKLYYFSNNPMNKYETHEQVRGQLARPYFYISFPNRAEDNPTYYFDAETGVAVTNQFVYTDGHWYYFGNDGKALLFDQVINGQHLYFDYEGKQVKGDFVTDYKGTRYYDENSGELVTNQTRTINGVTYHFDKNGRAKQL